MIKSLTLEKKIEKEEKENQNITKLENEKNEIIASFEKYKAEVQNEINDLKSKIQLDANIFREYEYLIIKYKDEINKLNKDKQLLEIAINGDIDKINQLKNLEVEFLKPKDNLITIDPETNKISSKEIFNKKIIFQDFYDVIIDINSIKDINKGWEIKMSQRAKEKYNSLKKEKIIKIGVTGNLNKGKSFLLSKISKIKLPSGTSIRTEA